VKPVRPSDAIEAPGSQQQSPPNRYVEHTSRSLAADHRTRHEDTKLHDEDAEEKDP
jgi:hypothetical protein